MNPNFEHKICEPGALAARAAALPRPRVMTNGVFDLLHRGHVSYLAQARALGASLLVAVNSDESVRRLGKGPERPLNSCVDRLVLLAALESTSLLSWFDEDDAARLVLLIRPEVYVKGGDYRVEHTAEGRAALASGAQIRALGLVQGYSTSEMMRRLRHDNARS